MHCCVFLEWEKLWHKVTEKSLPVTRKCPAKTGVECAFSECGVHRARQDEIDSAKDSLHPQLLAGPILSVPCGV